MSAWLLAQLLLACSTRMDTPVPPPSGWHQATTEATTVRYRGARDLPVSSPATGAAVATIDVDLDGIVEVIVGAPSVVLDGHSDHEEGKVFALQGARLSNSRSDYVDAWTTADSIVTAGPRPVYFGSTISAQGDVDADGTPGLYISGWSLELPLPPRETHVDQILQWRWDPVGPYPNQALQSTSPPCGDVDADGNDDYCQAQLGVRLGPLTIDTPDETRADLRLGGEFLHSARVDGAERYSLLWGHDNAEEQRGTVFIDHPPVTGTPDVEIVGLEAGQKIGNWLSVGELTGDDTDDVVVASVLADGRSGRVWIHSGTDRSGILDEDIVIEGSDRGALGYATVVGDFDGDGQSDLAVGSAGFPTTSTNVRGRVLIFRGPIQAGRYDEDDADAVWVGSYHPGDRFGHALAAGDVDDDGVDELIVGAPGDSGVEESGGAAFVIWGALDL